MKNLFIAIFAVLAMGASSQALNNGVKFSSGTFAELSAEAVKAKKLLFIDIYATWCRPCKNLSANIFTQTVVGDKLNALFVCSKFDGEKGEGVTLSKTYKVEGYPTLLIIDPADGKELTRLVGDSDTAKEFNDRVTEAVDAIKAGTAKGKSF